jgi:hypothetical protein
MAAPITYSNFHPLSFPVHPSRSYIAHYVLPTLRSYNNVAKYDEGLTEWALVQVLDWDEQTFTKVSSMSTIINCASSLIILPFFRYSTVNLTNIITSYTVSIDM